MVTIFLAILVLGAVVVVGAIVAAVVMASSRGPDERDR